MLLLRVGHPGQIQWKIFLRAAAPLAATVAFFTAYNPLLAWLVLLPGSVVLAIYLYRRRQPGPLRASQGAKLGSFIALLVFVFSSLLFAVAVSRDPAAYRQEVDKAVKTIQDMEARNPQAPQISQSLSNGIYGIVLFTTMSLASLLVFLLIVGSAIGALAASLSRERSSP